VGLPIIHIGGSTPTYDKGDFFAVFVGLVHRLAWSDYKDSFIWLLRQSALKSGKREFNEDVGGLI
jgi:hypothetical protein